VQRADIGCSAATCLATIRLYAGGAMIERQNAKCASRFPFPRAYRPRFVGRRDAAANEPGEKRFFPGRFLAVNHALEPR
jgi:hypothetical protein